MMIKTLQFLKCNRFFFFFLQNTCFYLYILLNEINDKILVFSDFDHVLHCNYNVFLCF